MEKWLFPVINCLLVYSSVLVSSLYFETNRESECAFQWYSHSLCKMVYDLLILFLILHIILLLDCVMDCIQECVFVLCIAGLWKWLSSMCPGPVTVRILFEGMCNCDCDLEYTHIDTQTHMHTHTHTHTHTHAYGCCFRWTSDFLY